MTNIQKLFAQPYCDNLVARCDECGKPIFACKCDEEEDEADIEDQMFEIERGYTTEEPTDAFGRNFSDADPGL